MTQRSHDKWNEWSTEELIRYINKYTSKDAPGPCSNSRRKKIKVMHTILKKRDQAIRLITM